MLLFWKHVDFSRYEVTETDRIVNYTVGTLLIFCFLISTILNPVIWYHHRSEDKNKITTFLFSYLAIADFLTNLVAPLGYSYLLMSPKLFFGLDLEYLPFEFLACTLGCFSLCAATLLAISRTLKIINPFRTIQQRSLKIYIFFYSLFMMAIGLSLQVIAAKMIKKSIHTAPLPLINFILDCLCYWFNIMHCILGTAFSIVSVVYVYLFSKPVSQNQDNLKKRASITVLLMNLVYIITISCMFLNVFQRQIFKQGVDLMVISFIFNPMLISAFNPIILFARVRKIRQTFYSLIRSCIAIRMRLARVTPVVFDNVQLSNIQNTVAGSSVTVIETAQ